MDGKEQDFYEGQPYWRHRGYMVAAWEEPASTRWHASPQFDLAEGIYRGPYGDSSKIRNDDNRARAAARKDNLRDISHQRLLQLLKKHGVWIVTDRLCSPSEHSLHPAVGPAARPANKGETAFTPEQIKVAEHERTIRTSASNMVNHLALPVRQSAAPIRNQLA